MNESCFKCSKEADENDKINHRFPGIDQDICEECFYRLAVPYMFDPETALGLMKMFWPDSTAEDVERIFGKLKQEAKSLQN